MNGYDKRELKTPTLSTPMAKGVRDTWRTLPADEAGEGSFVRLSTDHEMRWGEKIRVPVTAPHGSIRRADGSLLYLGKVFLYDKEDYAQNAICAVESRDDGQTWQRLGYVPVPEGIPLSRMHEPHVVELSDGSILTVYYQKYGEDTYNSILYTKWQLSNMEGEK